MQLEKRPRSNEDPVQPNINKCINIFFFQMQWFVLFSFLCVCEAHFILFFCLFLLLLFFIF